MVTSEENASTSYSGSSLWLALGCDSASAFSGNSDFAGDSTGVEHPLVGSYRLLLEVPTKLLA